MNYFYVITPVRCDPLFQQKKIILSEVGYIFDVRPFFPLEEHQSFKLETMIADVQNAKFVIADLSYERPSCYFEVGIAEVIGTKINLIAEAGTRIHQVSDATFVRYYDNLKDYRACIAELFN